jgi:hypothetical protein
LYLRKGEVGSSFAVSTWQSVMLSEFEALDGGAIRAIAMRPPAAGPAGN